MKLIALHKSKLFTIVDDEDYDFLMAGLKPKCFWYRNNVGYTVAQFKLEGGYTFTYLHRLLIPCPKGLVIDHINRNKLDNQKSNLRAVTIAENIFNSKKYNEGFATSKHKGVSYRGPLLAKPWAADFRYKGLRYFLGCYETEQEAFEAYTKKVKEVTKS